MSNLLIAHLAVDEVARSKDLKVRASCWAQGCSTTRTFRMSDRQYFDWLINRTPPPKIDDAGVHLLEWAECAKHRREYE